MMDCAGFCGRLAELMGAEGNQSVRSRALAELTAHARSCPSCAGCSDLLELLALPPDARDLAEDPGEPYWESFGDRLRARLDEEPAPARWRPGWAAAAAMVVLVLGAAWLWRAGQGSPDPISVAPVLPEELNEVLAQVSFEEAMGELELVTGLEGPWSEADEVATAEIEWAEPASADLQLFPETSDLSPEARQELMQWLMQQDSRMEGVSS